MRTTDVCSFISRNNSKREDRSILNETLPRHTQWSKYPDRHELAMQLAADLGRSTRYWERKIGGAS